MANDWHNIHITDKSGKIFFNTNASPRSTMSEIRNLKRHIDTAKQQPTHYSFLDVSTAQIILDGVPYSEPTADDVDQLLKELGV